jgi:hypothetical protein
MTRLINITESVNQIGQKLRVDRERGIIYGVKVLGERSANPAPDDNEYPLATRAQAIQVLEGMRGCVDHPPRGKEGQTRPYADNMGVHRNLHEGGDGLYGDYHFNPKHPSAEQLCWDAENAPHLLGFSINARGRTKQGQGHGRCVIESIVNPNSIDLVSRAATTKGLFESRQEPKMLTLKTVLEAKTAKPDILKLLTEMAATGCYAKGMESEIEAAPADHNETLKSGFKQAINDVLDDDTMDVDAQVARVNEILKAHKKLAGKADESSPEGKGDGKTDEGDEGTPKEKGAAEKPDKKAQESLQEAQSELKLLREEAKVKDAIVESGLKFATPAAAKAFAKSLVTLTESDRKALIEDRKAATPGNRPGSGRPQSGSAGSGTGAPGAGKQLVESIDSPEKRQAYLKQLRG